jgi:hypothetical protein
MSLAASNQRRFVGSTHESHRTSSTRKRRNRDLVANIPGTQKILVRFPDTGGARFTHVGIGTAAPADDLVLTWVSARPHALADDLVLKNGCSGWRERERR